MKDHPLFFRFQELVYGRGFVAGVAGTGRALGVCEDDGAWWFYGVEPAGLAAMGDTPTEAHLAFLASFRGVLFDVASDAVSFDAFRVGVLDFFHGASAEDDARWRDAALNLREGRAEPSGDFPKIPRWRPEETAINVQVVRLDMTLPSPEPQDNVVPELATAA